MFAVDVTKKLEFGTEFVIVRKISNHSLELAAQAQQITAANAARSLGPDLLKVFQGNASDAVVRERAAALEQAEQAAVIKTAGGTVNDYAEPSNPPAVPVDTMPAKLLTPEELLAKSRARHAAFDTLTVLNAGIVAFSRIPKKGLRDMTMPEAVADLDVATAMRCKTEILDVSLPPLEDVEGKD